MKKQTIFSIGIVLSSFTLAGFILLRTKPMVSDAAEDCLRAMLEGSANSCTSNAELGALAPYKLNEGRQARLMRDYFGQRLKGYSVNKITAEVNSVSGYGFAVAQLQKDGEQTRMLISGMLYPEGPRIPLASMIESLWLFQRGGTKMSQLTGHEKLQFRLDGLKRDREQLTALGIPGFYDEDGNFQSWDQIEAFYERVLPLNP